MRIEEWLEFLASENGSDLYLSTGAPPCAKFQGQLKPIGSDILQPGEIREIAMEVMDETQQAEFDQELALQQAAISVLAQANVQPQSALTLLQG